jgi:hypothetical protein
MVGFVKPFFVTWCLDVNKTGVTYNVALRRVPEIIVAVEKQWVLHVVSVFS